MYKCAHTEYGMEDLSSLSGKMWKIHAP